MTVDEIYSTIAAHMVKGLMIHSQMVDYYNFLNLHGYACCHEYHFAEESKSYRKLMSYYVQHHHKLIQDVEIENPEVIPSSWYKYRTQDLDANTVRQAVKDGLTKWINWEHETKELYSSMYKELLDSDAISDTIIVSSMVTDVACELQNAEKYRMSKEFTNYDISGILAEQACKQEEYKKKMSEIEW